jgi:hypothetical protein
VLDVLKSLEFLAIGSFARYRRRATNDSGSSDSGLIVPVSHLLRIASNNENARVFFCKLPTVESSGANSEGLWPEQRIRSRKHAALDLRMKRTNKAVATYTKGVETLGERDDKLGVQRAGPRAKP